jgi:UDP-N-acetylmuramoyl-tripeptide--D-alanyl-D-alanine ligase
MVGEQNLNSLLAAAAVAYKMGEPFTKISNGLAKITSINGRMNLLKGVNGSKLIDDSYNSSPDAVFAALDVLADFKAKSRIAVLGNMNELGEYTNKSHYKVGKAAAKVADTLIVIGKDAEVHMVSGATDAGMDPDNIKIFKTPYEAGHFLKRVVKRGDVVLIKGSQNGVFLEEATRILLDPSQKPEEVLVRQSPSWKRRKRRAFGL